jgi:ArsR family transcriptional regulator
MIKNKDKCCIGKMKEDLDVLRISRLFKVLSDLNRLRIVSLLKDGELCVCEIYKALALSQNLVSHHLSKLKEVEIIDERRDGNFILYKLNKINLDKYSVLYKKLIGE